jgi:hypothetical protein
MRHLAAAELSRRAVLLPLLAAAIQPLALGPSFAAPPAAIQPPDKGFATASGLRYFDFREGTGPQPRFGQLIRFHYVAYVANAEQDGLKQIDSSYTGGSPYFTKHGNGFTAQGIEEALHTMRPGGLRRIILPKEISFTADKGPIPGSRSGREALYAAFDGGDPLIFDLQLVSVRFGGTRLPMGGSRPAAPKTAPTPRPDQPAACHNLPRAYNLSSRPPLFLQVMDDLLDRGDYDDGNVSDLEREGSSQGEDTREPGAPTRNPFAAGNGQ